jgi:hypothetical protein
MKPASNPERFTLLFIYLLSVTEALGDGSQPQLESVSAPIPRNLPLHTPCRLGGNDQWPFRSPIEQEDPEFVEGLCRGRAGTFEQQPVPYPEHLLILQDAPDMLYLRLAVRRGVRPRSARVVPAVT